MLKYHQCQSIVIDGSSLEGNWLTRRLGVNTQGRMNASNYESEILRMLDKLMTRRAGWAVIRNIFDVSKRKGTEARIVPYDEEDKQDPHTGPHGAYGMATNVADSTPHGEHPFRGHRDNAATPFDERQNQFNFRGTGRGSNTELHYSPSVLTEYMPKCVTPFPVAGVCGTTAMAECRPDDILLHELVHNMRQMEGLLNQVPTAVKGYNTEEEFFAIVTQNVYMSECGRTLLRKDHKGYQVLDASLSDSAKFLGKGKTSLSADEKMNRRLVNKLVSLHGDFAGNLARSPARFNPVREYLNNQKDYPLS